MEDEEVGEAVGKGDPGSGNSLQGKEEEKSSVLFVRGSRGSSA